MMSFYIKYDGHLGVPDHLFFFHYAPDTDIKKGSLETWNTKCKFEICDNRPRSITNTLKSSKLLSISQIIARCALRFEFPGKLQTFCVCHRQQLTLNYEKLG